MRLDKVGVGGSGDYQAEDNNSGGAEKLIFGPESGEDGTQD
jgi:hypothetical protein